MVSSVDLAALNTLMDAWLPSLHDSLVFCFAFPHLPLASLVEHAGASCLLLAAKAHASLAVSILAPTSVYKLTAKPAKLIMGENGGKTKRGELSDGVERTSHALMS